MTESENERKVEESSRMWQHLWKYLRGVGGGECSETVQIFGRAWFQWSGHVYLREMERESERERHTQRDRERQRG